MRAILDLHGFTRQREVPEPPPEESNAMLGSFMRGRGVREESTIGGNEESMWRSLARAEFELVRIGTGEDGEPLAFYECINCPACTTIMRRRPP